LDALAFWLAWAALWTLADLPRRRREAARRRNVGQLSVADEAEDWLREQ
jgi:hypothetical protein